MSSLPEVETGNDASLYNIGVVSRMTGLSMPTLRIWERRYGFPDLARTGGGHRLYSEKDILRLRWVKERIAEGMQTAQAIDALRHQEATGHIVENNYPYIHKNEKEGFTKDHLNLFSNRLYDALAIRRDIQLADELFNDALAFIPLERIILHGVTTVLSKIGEGWSLGEVSISGEHLATNYLRQRLLFWMLTGSPLKIKHPIILACAPGEWHEGSLLVIGAILRRRRYPIAYLGQSVPLEDLEKFILEMKPPLVVLVALLADTGLPLIEWSKHFAKHKNQFSTIIGYGGKAFIDKPDWQLKMEGVYLGNSMEEGIESVERLLANN